MHPMSAPIQNLSKTTGRYVENTKKNIVFLMTNMPRKPLWLTLFREILLVGFFMRLILVGSFSCEAHFGPQICSNGEED